MPPLRGLARVGRVYEGLAPLAILLGPCGAKTKAGAKAKAKTKAQAKTKAKTRTKAKANAWSMVGGGRGKGWSVARSLAGRG